MECELWHPQLLPKGRGEQHMIQQEVRGHTALPPKWNTKVLIEDLLKHCPVIKCVPAHSFMWEDWHLWENKTVTSGLCPWGHPHPAAKDWHRKGQRKRFEISYELGFLLPAECSPSTSHTPPHIIMELLLQTGLGKDKKWDHWTVKGERERWELDFGSTELQM